MTSGSLSKKNVDSIYIVIFLLQDIACKHSLKNIRASFVYNDRSFKIYDGKPRE